VKQQWRPAGVLLDIGYFLASCITEWTVAATNTRAQPGNLWQKSARLVVPCAVMVALVAAGALKLTRGGDFRSDQPGEVYRKEAGLWLAAANAPRTVMGPSNEVAYYARAIAMRFPYAPDDRALAYIHAKAPDYIVLIRERSAVGPYYSNWRKHGIPDPAAPLGALDRAAGRPGSGHFQVGSGTAIRNSNSPVARILGLTGGPLNPTCSACKPAVIMSREKCEIAAGAAPLLRQRTRSEVFCPFTLCCKLRVAK
jgi:hypothetical protein